MGNSMHTNNKHRLKLLLLTLLISITMCNKRIFKSVYRGVFPEIKQKYKITSLLHRSNKNIFYLGYRIKESTLYYYVAEIHGRKLYKCLLPTKNTKIMRDSEKPYAEVIVKTRIKSAELLCFNETLKGTIYALRHVGCWVCFDKNGPDYEIILHIPKNSFFVVFTENKKFVKKIEE